MRSIITSTTTTTKLVSPTTMRSPFVCVRDNDLASSSCSLSSSMSRFSTATSPASSFASSFGVDAARFFHAPTDGDAAATHTTADDEVLGSIARSAMHCVLAVAASNTFEHSDWTPRRYSNSNAHDVVLEQRTASSFSVVARSVVPCTVDELSHVLSSADSDQLNASMIAILGDRFGYAVNVRSVPTLETNTDLSVKFLAFGRSRLMLRPRRRSVSPKRSVTLLDFVETDVEHGTVCRVLQSIKRSQGLTTSTGDRRPDVLGDALVGYVLREDPVTKHTVVFVYGRHAVDASRALRRATIETLRKMTRVTDTWVRIVQRRRLGAMQLLQGPRALSLSSSSTLRSFAATCFTCDAAFQPLLLRKKHFCCLCGYYTCGRCSREAEAEERIGLVVKVRVCVDCLTNVSRRTFESV